MPPIINPIYTKDFPPIGRALLDTDIVVVAITGDNVTYRSTVGAVRTALAITFTGTASDPGGDITATTGTDRLICCYEGDDLVYPLYNKSTKLLSGFNPGATITAYFI
jgi:hypothetical protein